MYNCRIIILKFSRFLLWTQCIFRFAICVVSCFGHNLYLSKKIKNHTFWTIIALQILCYKKHVKQTQFSLQSVGKAFKMESRSLSKNNKNPTPDARQSSADLLPELPKWSPMIPKRMHQACQMTLTGTQIGRIRFGNHNRYKKCQNSNIEKSTSQHTHSTQKNITPA